MTSLLARPTAAWRAVRLAVLRRRRPLAAVLAAVAVLSALTALRAPSSPTEQVTVAAHDLPAGATLGPDDLREAAWARGTPPSDVVPAGSAVGRVLAGPLRAGEPLTDVRLVGPGLVAGRDGLVAVPVRLPDAGSVALLHPGDHVDLIAADPQGGTAVPMADDVPVLAVPPADGDTASSGTGLSGRLVVVGVPPSDVAQVAQAGVTSFVTYAWSSH